MPLIRQLSPSVVNKIAAGEVIERPSSVVKELLENSLDAGATRVDVSVEQGGIELVRVVDNGCGIEAEQLPLAVASHATSKLQTADDLFRVGTLGFRGEALASIAEVSRFVLRSQPPAAPAGAELEVVGGAPGPVTPCAAAPGTSIEVRNLFFNTPVRRKFLRSTQTEMGHVNEAFTRLALAYPQVHFTLWHNNKPVFDLPPTDEWQSRIALVFGSDLADDLVWVESSDGRVRLSGYVAKPNQSRSHPRMQYLFLNGRHIRDRALQHALSESYRGLLLTGRYPITFLRFDMPAEEVDVNVHPTKLEVRFQDGGRIYSQLLGTLRNKFLTTDLTHRLEPVPDDGPGAAHDPQQTVRMRQELVDWAHGQTAPAGPHHASGPVPAFRPFGVGVPNDAPRPQRAMLELNRLDRNWPAVGQPAAPPAPSTAEQQTADSVAPTVESSYHAQHVRALQVHNCYLLVENDEGLLVIDQHALHERILYEQLRAKASAGALESQQLLVPEPVDLSGPEAARVLEQTELLAQLGVRVEPFGGDTVLVSSYPAMLVGKISPAEVLRLLVEQVLVDGKRPERRDLLDELLHMFACKAAIKSGDRLSPAEIEALLAQRHLAQDSHHCPHGRPTALVFTREELDKQFKRI